MNNSSIMCCGVAFAIHRFNPTLTSDIYQFQHWSSLFLREAWNHPTNPKCNFQFEQIYNTLCFVFQIKCTKTKEKRLCRVQQLVFWQWFTHLTPLWVGNVNFLALLQNWLDVKGTGWTYRLFLYNENNCWDIKLDALQPTNVFEYAFCSGHKIYYTMYTMCIW